MGSGKSLIGKLLAERLQIKFYDLDHLIEFQMQMSITEIFKMKGEIFFRKIESQLFHELMQSNETFVLSLGGGTPCYANSHLLLSSEYTTSIYLSASIDTLFSRLSSERFKRPLIAKLKDDEFKEYIAKHLFERSYFYNQATLKILSDKKTPDEIVSLAAQLLA